MNTLHSNISQMLITLLMLFLLQLNLSTCIPALTTTTTTNTNEHHGEAYNQLVDGVGPEDGFMVDPLREFDNSNNDNFAETPNSFVDLKTPSTKWIVDSTKGFVDSETPSTKGEQIGNVNSENTTTTTTTVPEENERDKKEEGNLASHPHHQIEKRHYCYDYRFGYYYYCRGWRSGKKREHNNRKKELETDTTTTITTPETIATNSTATPTTTTTTTTPRIIDALLDSENHGVEEDTTDQVEGKKAFCT